MRIALGIEYDGSAFSGWQVQSHARSVQGELEQALARVADHDVRLTVAGRTDAGVHAINQVAHFDATAERSERAWALGANNYAGPDLSVLWARVVTEDFNARYSAQWRRYLYRIVERPTRPALQRARTCWSRKRLDVGRMHEAAQCLLGQHDFSAFRAAECQARTVVREVISIDVRRDTPFVEIDISANAFLHHMVRNIAGSLMAVGAGTHPPSWLETVLESRERRLAGMTAPAAGLYLVAIGYPARFKLPVATPDPRSSLTCQPAQPGV